jgi:blue copper oxidase
MKITRSVKGTLVPFLFLVTAVCCGQSPLYIPDTLSGKSITLNVQTGTKQFFVNNNTPTYGYNGNILGPTLFINEGDSVTLHVKNTLSVSTTVHWHGLHVAAMNDGGPHQLILPGGTWSPSFKVRNEAATFWYHPHGEGKTEIQVSRGLAGMLIVRDKTERAYNLPRRYKTDDFPLIVQSKAFDVLYQFATATHEDSVIMVNGTIKPFLQVPRQVVRLRLLNGSADRTYNFGLSDNSNFFMIASDGGFLSQPVSMNRLKLSVGERAEILVDLTTYTVGSQLYLKSFASELPRGTIGADSVGTASIVMSEGYYDNPLNGADFNVLRLDVVSQTTGAVLSIPTVFSPKVALPASSANTSRHIHFSADTVMSGKQGYVDGPFYMNNQPFHMDSVNIITFLNNTEIWTLTNKTMVAHPFHIHDIQFYVLDINGMPPPPQYRGLKDVILVQPDDTVRFITKFTDFADPMVPYMFHCHLLHHEDDGMMGTFIVLDPAGINSHAHNSSVRVYPNPSAGKVHISTGRAGEKAKIILRDICGKILFEGESGSDSEMDLPDLSEGVYLLEVRESKSAEIKKLVICK